MKSEQSEVFPTMKIENIAVYQCDGCLKESSGFSGSLPDGWKSLEIKCSYLNKNDEVTFCSGDCARDWITLRLGFSFD